MDKLYLINHEECLGVILIECPSKEAVINQLLRIKGFKLKNQSVIKSIFAIEILSEDTIRQEKWTGIRIKLEGCKVKLLKSSHPASDKRIEECQRTMELIEKYRALRDNALSSNKENLKKSSVADKFESIKIKDGHPKGPLSDDDGGF